MPYILVSIRNQSKRTLKSLVFGVVLLSAACLPAQVALAAGTAAGTPITNQATANYTVGSTNYTENSNTTTTRVAEILNVDVVWQDAGNVTVIPGDTGRVLTFQVTNTGNGTDDYTLAGLSTLGGDDFDFENWRIVNNMNLNVKLNPKTQIAMQYGAKYVRDTIDGDDYSGFTDLIGLEARYDVTQRWDVGVHGSILHSWNSDQFDYSTGLSLGCNVFKNAWVSVGYNFLGFEDEDFSDGHFTAQGPFVTFRIKIDQQSVRDIVKKWIFK